MDKVIDAVQVIVEEKIDMFNAAGKAATADNMYKGAKKSDEDAFN